jgi:hypothetical protein
VYISQRLLANIGFNALSLSVRGLGLGQEGELKSDGGRQSWPVAYGRNIRFSLTYSPNVVYIQYC